MQEGLGGTFQMDDIETDAAFDPLVYRVASRVVAQLCPKPMGTHVPTCSTNTSSRRAHT